MPPAAEYQAVVVSATNRRPAAGPCKGAGERCRIRTPVQKNNVDARLSVRANLPLVDVYLHAGLDALGDATRMAIFQNSPTAPSPSMNSHGQCR